MEMPTEIVLYRLASAGKAHRELFGLPEACYVALGDDIIGDIRAAAGTGISRLHILACWEDMLRVALWTSSRPVPAEVFTLLKKASAAEADLAPFRDADVNDLFPSLYYGKRIDVLRRVCVAAKARAELKIGRKNLMVYCHLVPEDGGRIVASNL